MSAPVPNGAVSETQRTSVPDVTGQEISQGSGKGDRITATDGRGGPSQSVLDSLADAETLIQYVVRVECDLSYMGSIVTAYNHLHAGHVHMARQTYIAAAHHLFTAIPELREPDVDPWLLLAGEGK